MAQRTDEHGQPVGEPVPGWAPPPRPADDLVLTGEDVRLEPLRADLVPGLFAATCGPGTEAAWTYMSAGPFADEAGLSAYLETMATQDWLPLAIRARGDDRVLGMAAYLRIAPGAGTIEVGAIMLGPELARTRAATETMWLMAEHVFGLGYRRYEWKCDALNAPSRRAAERLGFRHEGTWRQALVYKGRNRDTAWFAMTDGDWVRLGPAFREWLDQTRGGRPQTRPLGELTAAALQGERPAGVGHFDARAATWDQDPAKIERAARIADCVAEQVRLGRGLRVLEYGAGTGLVSQALMDRVGPLTLVDTSSGMREVMAEKIRAGALPEGTRVWDLDLEQAGADRPDERFDLVVGALVLHHVQDLATVLAGLAGLLHPGGALCIADLDREDGSFHAHHDSFHGHDGFDRRELTAALSAVGLTDVTVTDCTTIEKEGRAYPVFLAVGRR